MILVRDNCKECTTEENCLCEICEKKCKKHHMFKKDYMGNYGCFNECNSYTDWLTKLIHRR